MFFENFSTPEAFKFYVGGRVIEIEIVEMARSWVL